MWKRSPAHQARRPCPVLPHLLRADLPSAADRELKRELKQRSWFLPRCYLMPQHRFPLFRLSLEKVMCVHVYIVIHMENNRIINK